MVDRYAKFSAASGALVLETGTFMPGDASVRSILSTQVVCGNVNSAIFKADGRSVQMILELDNGTQSITVATSAVMHNGS